MREFPGAPRGRGYRAGTRTIGALRCCCRGSTASNHRSLSYGCFMASACPTCGRPLDDHDRHLRLRLPDPVLATSLRERAPGVWMNGEDATCSDMLQVPGIGPSVRVLLPVSLTGGHTVTFGLWLAVSPDDLQRAFREWWAPSYADLVLDGYIGNDIASFDTLGRPAHARVIDADATPYIVESSDEVVERLLHETWDHETVLAPTDE